MINNSKFTKKSADIIEGAVEYASEMGHTYVGSEHLLLGLLRVGSGVAAAILNKNNVTSDNIKSLMESQIGVGTPTKLSPEYFTPRAKRVIEAAFKGSTDIGKSYVGTEHIFIGILSDGDNYAIRFLKSLYTS